MSIFTDIFKLYQLINPTASTLHIKKHPEVKFLHLTSEHSIYSLNTIYIQFLDVYSSFSLRRFAAASNPPKSAIPIPSKPVLVSASPVFARR